MIKQSKRCCLSSSTPDSETNMVPKYRLRNFEFGEENFCTCLTRTFCLSCCNCLGGLPICCCFNRHFLRLELSEQKSATVWQYLAVEKPSLFFRSNKIPDPDFLQKYIFGSFTETQSIDDVHILTHLISDGISKNVKPKSVADL